MTIRPATGISVVVNGRAVTVLLGELAPGATLTFEIDAVLAKTPRTDVTIAGKVVASTASLDMNSSNDIALAGVGIPAQLYVQAPTDDTLPAIVMETPTLVASRRRRCVRWRFTRAHREPRATTACPTAEAPAWV
mgnify:CR=1 FL=1